MIVSCNNNNINNVSSNSEDRFLARSDESKNEKIM